MCFRDRTLDLYPYNSPIPRTPLHHLHPTTSHYRQPFLVCYRSSLGQPSPTLCARLRQMWLLSMLTCLVVALVMWLTNHGGTVDTKLALAKKLPELYDPVV